GDESLGVGGGTGGDDFGVVGGVALDVDDGGLQVVDHAHGQHQVQVFGVPVRVGGRDHVRHQGARCVIASQFDATLAQRDRRPWQEFASDVLVHQQGFQRVAGRGPAALAVDQQGQRLVDVGIGVDEQVAHALVVLDHR